MSDFQILIPIIGILVGGTALILPIAGLTARFALKPVVEAYARLKTTPDVDARLELMERRMTLLEDQITLLERENQRLVEDADFRGRLAAGK